MPGRFVIDAGHGGWAQAGRSSPLGVRGPRGTLEKDVVLKVAERIAARLGGRALLTRRSDVNLTLADRAQRARPAGAFVSLHCNTGRPGARGTEIWTHPRAGASSRALATALGRQLARLGGPRGAALEGELALLDPDGPAACLIELDYLSDPDAEERLLDEQVLDALGDCIARGLVEHLDGPRFGAPIGLFGYYQPVARAQSGAAQTFFLPGNSATDYTAFVRPRTTGLVELLINGRSIRGGTTVDVNEPLDAMEQAVRGLSAGDLVYLAAWFFEPATPLTSGVAYKSGTTWGDLFARKAEEGVVIRILINDFNVFDVDPANLAGETEQQQQRDSLFIWETVSSLKPLDAIIAALDPSVQDNLKYVVSRHPARVNRLESLAALGESAIYPASHHEKFMVVRSDGATTAFCGGVDIESRKAAVSFLAMRDGHRLPVWHDVHARLRGPIAKDLEREFVGRWNREKDASRRPGTAPPGWKPLETLALSPASIADNARERRVHQVQMLRTVSSDGLVETFSNDRHDIEQVYRNTVQLAGDFLYFENQYFRAVELADWIVERAQAQPSLRALFVVVASAAEDDHDNDVTRHGNWLQHEFFRKVFAALGDRARAYTMAARAVHSKMVIADDHLMVVGSANANMRSFQLDTELDVAVDDAVLVRDFRRRLWAHNLGISSAVVAGWSSGDFFAQWDAIADANATLDVGTAQGEFVVPFDWDHLKGKKSALIPDELANLDLAPEGPEFAGGPSAPASDGQPA